MGILVVFESMWGNTRAIAEAIARGLGSAVEVVDVAAAPTPVPADVDLLVIGGPTHTFSMSRGSTRADAVQKGADPGHEDSGIRDWLDQQPPSVGLDVATFDTRVVTMRHLPGSAAKAAAKVVRREHLGRLVGSESFYVDGMDGPLVEHEVERAEEWGRKLAAVH